MTHKNQRDEWEELLKEYHEIHKEQQEAFLVVNDKLMQIGTDAEIDKYVKATQAQEEILKRMNEYFIKNRS